MLTRFSSLLWLGLAATVFTPLYAQAEAIAISGVAAEVRDNDSEFVSFLTDVPVSPSKSFVLNNPDRIAIDIPKANGAAVRMPNHYAGRLVKSIRFGQFNADTSRIVLDLNYPVSITKTVSGSPFGVEIAPVKALPAENNTARVFNANTNKPTQVAEPKEKPEVSAKEKPLIAIDAGHGGQDPGAIGFHNTHERDITLNFAQNLAKALVKTGRYRVKLTRDTDHFVMLGDRVNIARKAKADLFISLHADSNPNPEARGLSIYTLSATASDAEAAALAERENKADIITGLDLNTTDQDVANILIDLTQRETMNKSLTLADTIVENMSPKINRLAKTHRFAGFRVLKAPDVPSVLIELGFITNENDERLLLSPDYRDLVVNSITKGVDRYYAAQ